MKAELIGKILRRLAKKEGVSTIEILIAFVVITVSLSAVIMVAFGSQAFSLDTELSNQALTKTEKEIENMRVEARADFDGLTTTSTVDGIYNLKVTPSYLSECVLQLIASTTWQVSAGRPQGISQTSFVGNPQKAKDLGEDCLVGATSGDDWRYPTSFFSIDFDPSGSPATGLDVKDKIAYMTGDPAGSNDKNFFVIDTTNLNLFAPDISQVNRYAINTAPPGKKSTLTAVDVAGNYAYVANKYVYQKISGVSYYNEQLLVIDISTPSAPVVVARKTLEDVTPNGSYPWAVSIYYADNKVYVGTWETSGPEFHVFNVSSPIAPLEIAKYYVNRSVNGIFVRGNYAYLATTGDDQELLILDISQADSGIITEKKKVDLPSDQDGTSIFVLGDRAYVGRERNAAAGNPEISIVDIHDVSNPTPKNSWDLGIKSGSYVSGVRATGNLLFLGTIDSNDPFQVWNISDESNVSRYEIDPINFSEVTSGVDYEGDIVYSSNRSNDALRILKANRACADGGDNDGDGQIDMADSKCSDPSDDNESQ